MSRQWPQLQQVLELLKQGNLLTRTEATEAAAQTAQQQWLQVHQGDLYVDGQYDPARPQANLSPIGTQVARLWSQGLRDLDQALVVAKQMMPKPATPRKSPKRARRNAPVARPSTSTATPDEIAAQVKKEDGDLDNFFLRAYQVQTDGAT